ncbi:MAG: hypothetical protein F6J93_00015 [Oscillatoria sp. SIO1A7]|nr:hypothetical protein [Oscillatoria sp. SIO1A7]
MKYSSNQSTVVGANGIRPRIWFDIELETVLRSQIASNQSTLSSRGKWHSPVQMAFADTNGLT